MSEGFPGRDDTGPYPIPVVIPFLINAHPACGGTTYLETFHKHFELVFELKILFRL